MQIIFLGVGESCDQQFGNTSILINAAAKSIMLDCGFSVPHRYFSRFNDPEKPDAVWISHFHGDHYFGMPLLLLRLWEMKRTRPLTIISHRGVKEKIIHALDTSYRNFSKKLSYQLIFNELEPGAELECAGFRLRGVETIHSERNLGILLEKDGQKIYYSGDGRPTKEVTSLLQGCELIIHESFRLVDDIPNHSSMTSCLKLLQETGAKQMAFIHLERSFRRNQAAEISTILQEHPNTLLPVDDTRLILQ